MPYLKVVITAIQIASGAQFANPEGSIYSEQKLVDGSVIATQKPLPLCEGVTASEPVRKEVESWESFVIQGRPLLLERLFDVDRGKSCAL